MKLSIKMFFWITIFFSAAFLICGFTLISSFYDTAVEKEIESTAQQYQYNRFVVQAAMITKNAEWITDHDEKQPETDSLVSELNGTAALFDQNGTMLFSGFADGMDFSNLLKHAKQGETSYEFMKYEGRMQLLVSGAVKQNDTAVYLITGADVQKILDQQKEILAKFGYIYAAALCTGIILIMGLSFLLTRPVKLLTAATQKIADGNYGERVMEFGDDELGQLARNFNQMAGAIEEKIKELSESARQNEDFAANFAHELKTPLTSVIGYADRIYQKELPREAQKDAALHIWNEGMRLEALSLKLMDLTVLNHKAFTLEQMDAHMLLKELSDDVDYMMKEKGISFHHTAQPADVMAEYDLFKTLFLNLVDNSIKAGADCICVTGSIVRTDESGSKYKIQVKDNGSGIPKDEISKITEAFYMADKSRSRKLHGAGLGLSLAQKIARIHGSCLEFESDGKTGTTVTVYLNRM